MFVVNGKFITSLYYNVEKLAKNLNDVRALMSLFVILGVLTCKMVEVFAFEFDDRELLRLICDTSESMLQNGVRQVRPPTCYLSSHSSAKAEERHENQESHLISHSF